MLSIFDGDSVLIILLTLAGIQCTEFSSALDSLSDANCLVLAKPATLLASAAICAAGDSPITATLYTTTYASACLLENPQAQYLWLAIHREFHQLARNYRLYGHFCDLRLSPQWRLHLFRMNRQQDLHQ